MYWKKRKRHWGGEMTVKKRSSILSPISSGGKPPKEHIFLYAVRKNLCFKRKSHVLVVGAVNALRHPQKNLPGHSPSI